MPSTAIILAVFASGTLFLATWAQGTGNHHQQQQQHGSHGSDPDPNRPYMRLWRKRGHDAVNYQYQMHKPMKNGQINQHGSVTVYKPPHKKNQPQQAGFMVSYSMSQDFDSNKPLHQNQNQNNVHDNSHRSPQGSSHDQYPQHQPAPYHPAPQHHYRNDGQQNNHHCYDTVNSGEVFCCSPSYNGGHERCWRQNSRWE